MQISKQNEKDTSSEKEKSLSEQNNISGRNLNNEKNGKGKSKKKTAICIVVLIVILIGSYTIYLSNNPQRLHQIELSDNGYIADMNFGGYNKLFLSNVTHILRVNVDTKQEINATKIPDDAVFSIGDFASVWEQVYVVTNSHNLVVWDYNSELWNSSLFEMWNVTDIEEIAIDCDRNIYFFGGISSGITIWYRSDSIVANLTTKNRLASNQIDNLFIRAGKLLIDMPNALQVYDIDTKTINWVLGLTSYSLKSIEFVPGTNELFVGSEDGLHICRLSEGNWTYFRTLGPDDNLPSPYIEDLDLDITGHKMIVATSLGICTVDIYDYDVDVIPETKLKEFKPTCLYHEYIGPICRIYFGTKINGLWWIDINYAAGETTDWSSAFQITFGAALASVFGIIDSEYSRWRDKQEKKQKQEMHIASISDEQGAAMGH